MDKDFRERFLEDRDETGRYIVTSRRTGKSYFVEPIDNAGRPADWGSYNPSTGKIENKKGFDKYTGSVHASVSMITEDNGFRADHIHTLEIGESPNGYIDDLDAKYPDKAK
jgi:hypothetical protein